MRDGFTSSRVLAVLEVQRKGETLGDFFITTHFWPFLRTSLMSRKKDKKVKRDYWCPDKRLDVGALITKNIFRERHIFLTVKLPRALNHLCVSMCNKYKECEFSFKIINTYLLLYVISFSLIITSI